MTWPAKSIRSGFTLIELLVALAIIGILIALMLSAVQKVRESANRAKCQNNLRQLALAAHMFEDSEGRLPYSQFLGPYGTGADSQSWSGLARLLPYLEQGTVYQQGGIPGKTLRDSGVAQLQLKFFCAPATARRARGSTPVTCTVLRSA